AMVFMLAPNDTQSELDGSRTVWVWFWVGALALFVADLLALYWVGMWQALTAKNPMRAVTGNYVRILILPNIAYALVCLVQGISASSNPTWKFFLGWWVGLGLAADFCFGLRARHKSR